MGLTPEELGQKIKEAQGTEAPAASASQSPLSKESSAAIRMGTDFSAAIVVGVVFGYWIDRWLHTKPFGMILFLFLGFGAGFMSIYRAQTNKVTARKKE